MTDIVERLRDVTSQTLTSECHQAADEIERLREAKKDALWVINQGQIEINRLTCTQHGGGQRSATR
jgi:hypothetical protein